VLLFPRGIFHSTSPLSPEKIKCRLKVPERRSLQKLNAPHQSFGDCENKSLSLNTACNPGIFGTGRKSIISEV